MLQKVHSMATNPPESSTPVTIQGTPEVKVKGIPTLIQTAIGLIGLAVLVVGSILGFGQLLMKANLEAMEARLSERSTKSESSLKEAISTAVEPLTEKEARARGILRRLLFASALTEKEKEALGKELEVSTMKSLVHKRPTSQARKSVESLLRDKQIEKREVAKFKWNDGQSEGQVRYFELLDSDLDLMQFDLFSEGAKSPCDSRILELGNVDAVVVQACEAHLDSEDRLEFIVIRNTE